VITFSFDPDRLGAWVRLARAARKDDPGWLPPNERTLRGQFERSHPNWSVNTHALILDPQGARCSVIVNPRLKDAVGTPVGQIGHFEATGRDPALRLLDQACRWLAERGCRQILGPMNGSTWHSYRFLTDGFAHPPFLLEPTNPPSYPTWWREAGFTPTAERYHSSEQDNHAVADALAGAVDQVSLRGYRVQPADCRDLEAVLKRVFELSSVAFAANAHFAPISWPEFRSLYDGIQRVLAPSLVHWVIAPDGGIVGFAFGLPDRAEAVRRMKGRGGLSGAWAFLSAPRPVRSVFKSMALLPEHQGAGVGKALFHRHAVEARALGLRKGVRALMAADSRSAATTRALHTITRRYALFARAVAA
jgi:GNAT superfamily N-acetyltransferase